MNNSIVRPYMSTVRAAGIDQSGRVNTNQNPARLSHPCRTLKVYHRTPRRRTFYTSIAEQLDAGHSEASDNFQSHGHLTQKESVCINGYFNTCAQLVLLPGSITNVTSVDDPPDWDVVARVVCTVSGGLTCPICLEMPIAPRMERCGHIYCLPCVIQYVNHDNLSTSKKCAICSWILKLENMKRVSIHYITVPKVGSSVEMVMMIKTKDGRVKRLHRNADNNTHLAFENYDFMHEQCADELKEVENELNSLLAFKLANRCEPYFLEVLPFIDQAIETLNSEIHVTRSAKFPPLVTMGSKDSYDIENGENVFYQASDGQLVFLDGLMWKCFLTEYHSPLDMPPVIDVQVLSVKDYTVSQSSKKRWRYLSHLPVGHSFSLLEVDLHPPLISTATLDQFSSALDKRSVERSRNLIEDLRLTKLKVAAENRISSLSIGFRLHGHAELSVATPNSPPTSTDFMPLCSTAPTSTACTTNNNVSFAEVTKSGALSVVGPNRVANFSRTPPSRSTSNSFNLATEYWPSLGQSPSQTKTMVEGTSNSQCYSPTSSSVPTAELRPALGHAEVDESVLGRRKRHSKTKRRHQPCSLDSDSLE